MTSRTASLNIGLSSEPWRSEHGAVFLARTIRVDEARFIAECWAQRQVGECIKAEEPQCQTLATEPEALRWITRRAKERGFGSISFDASADSRAGNLMK